ncbi:MAG TPA: hypothetical protein VI837_08135, partial [Blastocatellia bacterium]|nr:hypothetical protein [Blastocatellia bacterium]
KHDASKRLIIDGLDSSNGGTYQVQVFPTRYRPESLFLRIREDETHKHTFVLVPDPGRVVGVKFPSYADLGADLKRVLQNSKVEGSEDKKGKALYDALKPLCAAGLLNLYAKMKATKFEGGLDAFSFVTSLRRVRGERFFADVKKDFRDAVKNSIHSHLFDEAPGSLHKPPPGYVLDDSFKTPDGHGNLQVTFFRKADALEFIADVDIDGSKGLEHAFDVISHTISGKDSHPYDIHAILRVAQLIDTGYRLVV